MNQEEKKEIEKLPEKYRPLGAWTYFGYSLLFMIPLIGWIFLFVFAFNSNNIVRRSFARSYFCQWLLAGILITIFTVVAIVAGSAFLTWLQGLIPAGA